MLDVFMSSCNAIQNGFAKVIEEAFYGFTTLIMIYILPKLNKKLTQKGIYTNTSAMINTLFKY